MNANWELMGHALSQLFTLFQLQQQQQLPMPTIPLIPLPQSHHHQQRHHRHHRPRPLQNMQMEQSSLQRPVSAAASNNNNSAVSPSATPSERLAPDLVPPCPPPLAAIFTLLSAFLLLAVCRAWMTTKPLPSSSTNQARLPNLSRHTRHTPTVRRRLVSPGRMMVKPQPTPAAAAMIRRHQVGCFLRWWGQHSPVLTRLRPTHQAYLVLFHIQMMAWLTSSLIRTLATTPRHIALRSISTSTSPTYHASLSRIPTASATEHPLLHLFFPHKHVEMLE